MCVCVYVCVRVFLHVVVCVCGLCACVCVSCQESKEVMQENQILSHLDSGLRVHEDFKMSGLGLRLLD